MASRTQSIECYLSTKRFYHKYKLNHFLLLGCYALFIAGAAIAFYLIESRYSELYRRKWRKRVDYERSNFITRDLFPEIFNNSRLLLYVHNDKSQYLKRVIDDRLADYEIQLKLRPAMPTFEVNFCNSLFFVFSTITTIGYGHIYPVTSAGRIISMMISLIGIPFTIIVVKDVAYLLAVLLNYPCKLLETIWEVFRFCTLKPLRESDLERKLNDGGPDPTRDYRLQHADRLLTIPVTVAVFAIVGWVSFGCFLIQSAFDVSLVESIYVVINSLTTTGVHNIEIQGPTPPILAASFAYVLVGIAIVSLFINLLHTKFSRAYWMPGKLYLPLRQREGFPSIRHIGTMDSDGFEEMTISDMPLNHMVTLGILQSDDKCPLIAVMQKENAHHEAVTQTGMHYREHARTSRVACECSPPPVVLPGCYNTSREDVNELIVETYGARPARLINSREKSDK